MCLLVGAGLDGVDLGRTAALVYTVGEGARVVQGMAVAGAESEH